MMRDIFLFVHGMSPEREWTDRESEMRAFFDRMKAAYPVIGKSAPDENVIWICWGQEAKADLAARTSHERLRLAENHVADRIATPIERYQYQWEDLRLSLRKAMPWLPLPRFLFNLSLLFIGPFVRRSIQDLKLQLMVSGVGDVVHYASPEGERDLRSELMLNLNLRLQSWLNAGESLRLHVVAHSLGVTIAHDLLYALFRERDEPEDGEGPRGAAWADQDDMLERGWPGLLPLREARRQGRLSLGTFVSMASQLPLMHFRKNKIIEHFHFEAARREKAQRESGALFKEDAANQDTLSPLRTASIGVADPKHPGRVHWLLLYDPDDPLGFPTKALYADPYRNIHETPLHLGLFTAHACWQSTEAAHLAGEMISKNLE